MTIWIFLGLGGFALGALAVLSTAWLQEHSKQGDGNV